jgi:osmotically-inducible protein OsmY
MKIRGRGNAFALLAALAAVIAGCSMTPPKSPAQERADTALADRVYAALQANPIYYFRDVDVDVDDGVAHLGGYVWSTDALYHAQMIARAVPGVTAVRDEMKLEREANRGGGDTAGSQ